MATSLRPLWHVRHADAELETKQERDGKRHGSNWFIIWLPVVVVYFTIPSLGADDTLGSLIFKCNRNVAASAELAARARRHVAGVAAPSGVVSKYPIHQHQAQDLAPVYIYIYGTLSGITPSMSLLHPRLFDVFAVFEGRPTLPPDKLATASAAIALESTSL